MHVIQHRKYHKYKIHWSNITVVLYITRSLVKSDKDISDFVKNIHEINSIYNIGV